MADERKDIGGETRADTSKVNAPASDPVYRDALIGKDLGKCGIRAYIGEGKTSIVYEANYQPLNRTVAVKVLQEHLMKFPAVLKVFQQEGRAVAALDHENILKIYDVGADQGRHYLVLELLRGRTLLEEIADEPKGKFPLQKALEYVRQTASGLAAAHRKNLVHRDIKPQNLVIEPDGTLKIVDFGLAAEAEGAFSGGRLGTPHYMSTEQCRGEMAGTASDIYALGITLFHMLVGHPPYAGKLTTDAIIAEHLSGERLEPEKIRPDIPKAIADLIRRMTRSEMAQRPTAKEVRDTIAKSRPERGPTTGTVRRSRAARSAKRRARTKSNMGGKLILGGVLLIGAIILLNSGGGDDKPKQEPKVVQDPQPDPRKTVTKKPRTPKKDRSEKERLADSIKEARREEETKNWTAALLVYQQIMQQASADSREYREAKDQAEYLKDIIDAARKGKQKPRRKFITGHMSETAGNEFSNKLPEWHGRLRRLNFRSVLSEMEPFVSRTREHSAERGAIDIAIKRAGYIKRLIGLCEARAHALTGGQEFWSVYDFSADGDLYVARASAEGVYLKDEESEPKLRKWNTIHSAVLVGFLDRMRSGKSALENLWLGYFCVLVDDNRWEQYFDFALQADDSREMKDEIKALKGN